MYLIGVQCGHVIGVQYGHAIGVQCGHVIGVQCHLAHLLSPHDWSSGNWYNSVDLCLFTIHKDTSKIKTSLQKYFIPLTVLELSNGGIISI